MAAARPVAQELDRQMASRWPGQCAPARTKGLRALRRPAVSPRRDGELTTHGPVQHSDSAITPGSRPRRLDPPPELLVSRRFVAIVDLGASAPPHVAAASR